MKTRILLLVLWSFMTRFSHALSPQELEQTLDAGADRVVESRGNHFHPFSVTVGSTTAFPLYSVLPDFSDSTASTNTFRQKQWHKATEIDNPNGFSLRYSTWAFKTADVVRYGVIFASTTKTFHTHDDIYLMYENNADSGTVRGRIERE